MPPGRSHMAKPRAIWCHRGAKGIIRFLETRRLKSFLKIVDTGSLTRAASALNIAQPALSQQIASLEHHFKQKLLIRSQHGVTPTEAGRVLYRHAQAILKQLQQAEADVYKAAATLPEALRALMRPDRNAVGQAAKPFLR